MGSRLNPRLPKTHRNYTIEQVVRLFGVHKNTVTRWIKVDGLPAMTSSRPHLINGRELRKFLEQKAKTRKINLPDGHLYCLSCRAAKRPAGGMLEDISHGLGAANFQAICPTCENFMHRRVARSEMLHFSAESQITQDTS